MARLFLLLITLSSLPFVPSCLSTSELTYVSYPLINRDAEASLIRSQEADPSDLPEGMPMRKFVAAGRAMRARGEKQRWPTVVAGSPSYFNESVGDFYLTMSVGSPAQKIVFLLDTGSELTWARCRPCKVCSKTPGPPDFEFKKSSSYQPVTCSSRLCSGSLGLVKTACENSSSLCTFAIKYGDGSFFDAGYVAVESFHLSKAVAEPFVFGCAVITIDTSSGLLGLSPGPFSFTSQLLGGNSKLSKRFAYCLPDRFTGLNSGGAIMFGDYRLPAKLRYTPLQPPLAESFYNVKLEGISVGKTFIKAAFKREGGTIFDSGTYKTQLVRPLYEELVREVRRQTLHLHPFATKGQEGTDVCYRVSLDAKELPKVPLITMHFAGGVGLELGPDSVLVPHDTDAKGVTLCLAFTAADVKTTLIPNWNIIGNYQQQNYWVEHNLETFNLGLAKVKSCATKE